MKQEYPYWRYHKDHDPRLIKSDEDHENLPGKLDDWHDSPAGPGVQLEVYEANGGHQRIRRKKDASGALVMIEETPAQKHEEPSQGGEAEPEEDMSEKSEDEIREALRAHGYPEKKLAKKSKEQLLAMFAR